MVRPLQLNVDEGVIGEVTSPEELFEVRKVAPLFIVVHLISGQFLFSQELFGEPLSKVRRKKNT